MTTIKLCLKGRSNLVEYFQYMIWFGKYLPELTEKPQDITEITLNLPDQQLTFTTVETGQDGTVLIYNPDDRESWEFIEKLSKEKHTGPVVIAGWYKSDIVKHPVDCAFDLKSLDFPHFAMIWAEDLWKPLQYIAERVLDKELPDLVELLSPSYWGEDLLV